MPRTVGADTQSPSCSETSAITQKREEERKRDEREEEVTTVPCCEREVLSMYHEKLGFQHPPARLFILSGTLKITHAVDDRDGQMELEDWI